MSKRNLFPRQTMQRTVVLCLSLVVLALSVFYANGTYAADSRQIKLLSNNCLQCHVDPESTAPIMGVAKDWEAVLKQGEQETLRNVVLGIGGMPPLGYCSACSEHDLRELVRLIAGFQDE
ncbi:MAG: cytochrome c5 [Cryomorphaceae bacterium]|jgi:cytochrome c5